MNSSARPDAAVACRNRSHRGRVLRRCGAGRGGGVCGAQRRAHGRRVIRLLGASHRTCPGASRCTRSDWTAGREKRLTPSRPRRLLAFGASGRAPREIRTRSGVGPPSRAGGGGVEGRNPSMSPRSGKYWATIGSEPHVCGPSRRGRFDSSPARHRVADRRRIDPVSVLYSDLGCRNPPVP
jgi:hypothetical protein